MTMAHDHAQDRKAGQGSTETILESISDGVFTVDHHWRISYFNQAAEAITGVSRQEALGRTCAEVFKSNMCENGCPLRQTMEHGRPLINRPGFLVRPDGRKVAIAVSTALLRDDQGQVIGGAETFRDLSELEELKEQLKKQQQTAGLHSANPAMAKLLETLPVFAESMSTILVTGETGTGKEVLARAIHAASPRARGPFVALNCGALPDALLESELFGYRKGAFTGADRDKPGRFAAARGGTLFLDELGEISPAMQVKLLRVLQEREFEPLGSNKTEMTDARVICATNRDLAALVAAGSFRQDLYYRVNILSLHLPPLRERPEDLPALVEGFLDRQNQAMQKTVRGFSAAAWEMLYSHRWPGNIRELENLVERALVLCRGEWVEPDCLPAVLTQPPVNLVQPPAGPETQPAVAAGAGEADSIRGLKQAAERQAIQAALVRTGGNRAAAARALGINRATLYRKMAALGLEQDLP